MKSLVINLLFVLLHLRILVNVTANDVIGVSSCRYLGDVDIWGIKCQSKAVKIKKLPVECTSFIYDGVTCTENFIFNPSSSNSYLDTIHSLKGDKAKRPVFILFGYDKIFSWLSAVQPDNVQNYVQALSDFLKPYHVNGLILNNINFNELTNLNLNIPTNFSQQLSAYVTELKNIEDLNIGLYLNAIDMINFGNDPEKLSWFDFGVLNDVVDFYVIGFENFNPCTGKLLNDGIIPMSSTDPEINTLEKFECALKMSPIAKDKVYLEFLVKPTAKFGEEGKFMKCEVSYTEYCQHSDYKYSWCADNQDSLHAKGIFAKNNAKGFVVNSIDVIDRDAKCNCDNKYITFYMLLNGFIGKEMKKCKDLDGS